VRVPHLSPTTLTTDEQRLILRATARNLRDHTIISLALGTGLRLAEIVGLDVGDVFAPDGTPRVRVRVRSEIAKGSRAADVFLPDRLVAKLRRFWRWKRERGEDLSSAAPLFANQSGRRISKRRVQFAWANVAAESGLRPGLRVPCPEAHGGHERLPGVEGLVPSAEVCEAPEPVDDDGVHAPVGPGDGRPPSLPPLLTHNPTCLQSARRFGV
jgi:integrase